MKDYENSAPKIACVFNEHGRITFAQGEGGKVTKFSIVGYSGKIIKNHWFWGNLAFDLAGFRMDSVAYSPDIPRLDCSGRCLLIKNGPCFNHFLFDHTIFPFTLTVLTPRPRMTMVPF